MGISTGEKNSDARGKSNRLASKESLYGNYRGKGERNVLWPPPQAIDLSTARIDMSNFSKGSKSYDFLRQNVFNVIFVGSSLMVLETLTTNTRHP